MKVLLEKILNKLYPSLSIQKLLSEAELLSKELCSSRLPRWITASEIRIILHIIRKANSIIILLFIQNISKFLTSLPPLVNFHQKFIQYVVRTFASVDEILWCYHLKPLQQYFHVALFMSFLVQTLGLLKTLQLNFAQFYGGRKKKKTKYLSFISSTVSRITL